MNSYRKTARIVGVFFLVGYLIFINAILLDPILNAPDYLTNLYPHKTQATIAMLVDLTNGIAVVGIAVLMFPILKKINEALALWYVGFRVIESVTIFISAIGLLSLITLSNEYMIAGTPDISRFQTLGTLLLAGRDSALQMLLIVYSLGAVLFYYLVYRSKLIPKFISVWGLIAAPLSLAAPLLNFFGYNLIMILCLPGGLCEIFLGLWLIIKGFNSSAIESLFTSKDTNKI